MDKPVEKVEKKLNQYGIRILKQHDSDDGRDRVFYTDDMILFVNYKRKSIGVCFQVITKPEKSATLALILKETELEIDIMEPFIFNENHDFISGKEAYKLIEDSKRLRILREVEKQYLYTDILENSECYEC